LSNILKLAGFKRKYLNYNTPVACGLDRAERAPQKVLKAHLIVWGGNLAYLFFACLLQKL